MTHRRYCILCVVITSLAAILLLLGTPAVSRADEKNPSFLDDVAPIFKENCFACHDAKKRSGKYDMTTFEDLLKGGAQGGAVIASKPDESELMFRISTDEKELIMPPEGKGKPLSKEQAAIVQRWIEQGAKLDAGVEAKANLVRELASRWTPPMPPSEYQFPAIVNALAFSPDGKQLVVGGHHELTVWDIDSAKLVKRIHTRAERAYDMLFLPNGTLIVAGGRPGQEGDVRGYDIKPQAEPFVDGVKDPKVMLAELVRADDCVLCLGLSKDGKKLAAGGCDRTVRVWDVAGGITKAKLEQEIENHADWVLGIAFADDGKHLFTASRDKTAKAWDLVAKESVVTYPEHGEIVFDVAAQADGKVGYSVGADKQVRWWQADGKDAGKRVRNVGGHGDEIYKLLRHPKENWLITCSADKTVRVWDASNGKALKTLSGMSDYVYDVAVSEDGSRVVAGGYDGVVIVWNLNEGKELQRFNASPGFVAKE